MVDIWIMLHMYKSLNFYSAFHRISKLFKNNKQPTYVDGSTNRGQVEYADEKPHVQLHWSSMFQLNRHESCRAE